MASVEPIKDKILEPLVTSLPSVSTLLTTSQPVKVAQFSLRKLRTKLLLNLSATGDEIVGVHRVVTIPV